MTNEFNVVGERKDDERHLLVRGDDGRHYDYSLTSAQISPVEPDERWAIDPDPHEPAPDVASAEPNDPIS